MRTITEHDIENAQRLKNIYAARKHELGITQTDMANEMGVKQGVISQYMNCHIALNHEATINFARLLKVAPWDINPDLQVLDHSDDQHTVSHITVRVWSLDSGGALREWHQTISEPGQKIEAYKTDSAHYAPFLQPGGMIVVDRAGVPEPGDLVLVEHESGPLHEIKVVTKVESRDYVVRHVTTGWETKIKRSARDSVTLILSIHSPRRLRRPPPDPSPSNDDAAHT